MTTLPTKLITKPVDPMASKSVGMFKRPLGNLVRLKSADNCKNNNLTTPRDKNGESADVQEKAAPSASALSMLSSYSDSENESD